MNYAPIILFTYNRPDHLRKTIGALLKNKEAENSDLIIYSDAAKGKSDREGVEEVRHYLKVVTGFRSVRIIERGQNMGLAPSLIDGITSVVSEYGRAIVMEDDLVASPFFLRFMNDALEKYKDDDRVASIHGYVNPTKDLLPKNFFLAYMSSWGWATWGRAWKLFEPDALKLMNEIKSRGLEQKIDFNNSYYFVKMLRNFIKGKNSSWAIRWYVSIVLNDRLCLYPGRSLIAQIGCDGSGTHSSADDWFDVELSDSPIPVLDIPVEESDIARKAYERFYKAIKLTYRFKVKNLIKKTYKRFITKRH